MLNYETQTINPDSLRNLLVLNEGEKLDDHLTCLICQELVIDPLECEDCQNLFCLVCINQWKQKSQQCPFKCPSNPIKLKSPHRFVKNSLNSLRFKCLNKENGCVAIITMEQIKPHTNECNFQKVKCKSQGCNFECLRNSMPKHLDECPFQEARCKRCGVTSTKSLIGQHDCVQELIKRVEALELDKKQQQELTIIALQKITNLEKIMSELQYTQQTNKVYKCAKNHVLQWYNAGAQLCNQCKQSNECIRYICKDCKVGFCQRCKVPQIVNNQCPSGHQLEHLQDVPRTISCDLCGQRPAQIGCSDWRDANCDFDICNDCYKTKIKQ